ncbi:MAG: type II toxin-antitoxin system VapC family toxin [Alphaproteobacteria bacterium]|nr:type II toxin-antitoxin system VapC family toxin [Alphaproteobacteria bacterium]
MLIIDSSAVVAMMLDEPSADALAHRLAAEPRGGRLMAAANYVEAGTVLAGRRRDPYQGIADLDAFLENFGVTIAAIDEDLARAALQARLRYGRGFGASAGLNFGDCFAYALAKKHNAPLLFIGDDFGATDVTPAV